MNKFIIGAAALSIGLSSNAMAGAPPMPKAVAATFPCVTMPIQDSAWSFGAELLYFQPNNSDLSYGVQGPSPGPATMPDGKTVQVEPGHHLGFNLMGAYHIGGTANDVSLHYTHLNTDDSDSANGVWIRLIHPDLAYSYTAHAKASANFDYNALDLLFGQKINFGKRLSMHISGGLRYARIDAEYKAKYTGIYQGEDLTGLDVKLNNDYYGIGPRVALAANFLLGRGFGLFGNAGSSLLVGINSAKRTAVEYHITRMLVVSHTVKQESTNHVVPELDSELGVNYALHFENSSSLMLRLGWHVVHYANTFNHMQPVDDFAEGVFIHNVSDISFDGPFLGATYTI